MIPQQNENSIFFLSDVVNCAQMVKFSKQLNISSLVNNILVVIVLLHISKQHYVLETFQHLRGGGLRKVQSGKHQLLPCSLIFVCCNNNYYYWCISVIIL
jgi:hypothetical protein